MRPQSGSCKQLVNKSSHLIQVHTLPYSLWLFPILHSKGQHAHPPSVAAATVNIIRFLSPQILLFNCFVLTHLKSKSQSGQSCKHRFGGEFGPISLVSTESS